MPASDSDLAEAGQIASMQYFVVMIDYGRRGREAIVDPEITRREVISRDGVRRIQEHQLHS